MNYIIELIVILIIVIAHLKINVMYLSKISLISLFRSELCRRQIYLTHTHTHTHMRARTHTHTHPHTHTHTHICDYLYVCFLDRELRT